MKDFVHKRHMYVGVFLFSSLLIAVSAVVFFGGFTEIKMINNNFIPEQDSVKAPTFSRESGFYGEPFYLEINAPKGTKVYYTLDCTVPDEKSIEYTGPIYLEDASKNENVYSMCTDISTGFYTDLIEKYQTADENMEYKAPDFLVEKCNIVNAVAIDENGRKSSYISKSYFVDLNPAYFGGVNIVTVTTDPDNLFSSDKGIYVTGDVFFNSLSEIETGSHWRIWPANYRERGKEWQRKASVSFFDTEGNLICEQQNAGIRTQGSVSRGTVPRSLNLFADNNGDKSVSFEADFFDTGFYPHSVTLSGGGNRLWTKLNDVFMSERCDGLHCATMNYKPYVLFLDGEYWGFYWLAERYDESYLKYYYGVDEDNLLLIRNKEVEIGDAGTKPYYTKMIYEISSLDMTTDAGYEHACELVDVDSFIDYYAAMGYIARQTDWPVTNFALWRTIDIEDNQYSDGKWRWMIFDCNSTSMNAEIIEDNSIEFIKAEDKLFAAFWQNETFRKKFTARLKEIAVERFDADDVVNWINQYDTQMRDILEKSWTRFHGSSNNKMEKYLDEMDGYRKFFEQRYAAISAYLDESS